jgi:hypothetical protein
MTMVIPDRISIIISIVDVEDVRGGAGFEQAYEYAYSVRRTVFDDSIQFNGQ